MIDPRPAPGGAEIPPIIEQNQAIQKATTRRTIQIADYRPHPRNYNRHPADQVRRIGQSLQTFGQVRSIVTWRGYFLAGHGVAEAAAAIGWSTLEADELPDDYPEAKALAYVAADNELSRLSDPDNAQLAAILQESRAADPALMAAIGYTDAELADLLKEINAEDGQYSRKIDSPIYEPKNAKPPISELYADAKTQELTAEIDAAEEAGNLPADVADFLRIAAQRHTVFNFSRIADFYAHADEQTQLLMERSALIIIDFEQAIEFGYVKLTKKIAELYGKDYPR